MSSFEFFLPLLPLISVLFTTSDAAIDFLVGGNGNSWKIPSFPDEFNKWAELNRFNINDTLSFKYDDKNDSVLVVTEDDYYSCNTTNPVQHYPSGNIKILLDRSGPFYFISGAPDHCRQGEKVVVIVISPDHWHKPDDPTPPAQPVPEPAPPSAPPAKPGRNSGHSLNGGLVGVFVGLVLFGFIWY